MRIPAVIFEVKAQEESSGGRPAYNPPEKTRGSLCWYSTPIIDSACCSKIYSVFSSQRPGIVCVGSIGGSTCLYLVYEEEKVYPYSYLELTFNFDLLTLTLTRTHSSLACRGFCSMIRYQRCGHDKCKRPVGFGTVTVYTGSSGLLIDVVSTFASSVFFLDYVQQTRRICY